MHGKNVVHMTSGTDKLRFFYDAQNRPAVVVYNGTAYAYVKSLQGDIVAILDENGNTVVSYGYDAWGAPLWCTGELAETRARCSRFAIAGMCLTRRRGCTIFVIGITILQQACFLQQTIFAFLQKLTIAFTKRIYTHIVIITPFLVMIRGEIFGGGLLVQL